MVCHTSNMLPELSWFYFIILILILLKFQINLSVLNVLFYLLWILNWILIILISSCFIMNINVLILYYGNRLFLPKYIGRFSHSLDGFILAFHYFHYLSKQLLILNLYFPLSVHFCFSNKLLKVSKLSRTFLIYHRFYISYVLYQINLFLSLY